MSKNLLAIDNGTQSVRALLFDPRGNLLAKQRSGVRITELRVAGGGSQSDAALQVTADVFGLPASHLRVYEASGLGAAIDAAVGVESIPIFQPPSAR